MNRTPPCKWRYGVLSPRIAIKSPLPANTTPLVANSRQQVNHSKTNHSIITSEMRAAGDCPGCSSREGAVAHRPELTTDLIKPTARAYQPLFSTYPAAKVNSRFQTDWQLLRFVALAYVFNTMANYAVVCVSTSVNCFALSGRFSEFTLCHFKIWDLIKYMCASANSSSQDTI